MNRTHLVFWSSGSRKVTDERGAEEYQNDPDWERTIDVFALAGIAHDANRLHCLSTGDGSQLPWESSPPWQRDSMVAGVLKIIENPEITPEQLHEAWCEHKLAEGWNYGPVKDAEAKTHPCLMPYDELPDTQRRKDRIIRAITMAFVA
jgi:hypothetical protein